jgi:hypothetical protein
MRIQRLVSLAVYTTVGAAAWLPMHLAAQDVPESALVNQRDAEALEAARAASPLTSEESLAYFRDDVDAAVGEATQRVWDPRAPRPPSPRTPWGDPDLRGYWLAVNYVPLERADALAGKPLYTVDEAVEVFIDAVYADAAVDPATVHYDWKEFGMSSWQSPMIPNLRTSLIVDPPDGKLPEFTATGRAQFENQARGSGVKSRSLFERCVTGNQGPPRLTTIRNYGESQIVQTPDYVLLITQVNSEARVVPLDGRAPPPAGVRSWLGSSSGHWEGDTLVVETTNFHAERNLPRLRGAGPNMHLTERYTRIDDGLMLYEATIDDPTTWKAPWTIEYPWPKMDPPGLYEFACHESNYGIINVVRGAQVREAEYEAGLEN